MKYFKNSIVFSIIGLFVAFFIGGFSALYITAVLAILEISLSFDNAIINAKVLNTMDEIWQKRFINIGIAIAVFGMRFLFPLLIVSIVADINLYKTFIIALEEPQKYSAILYSKEDLIYAFGGAFLLMVFLNFLFEEKEVYWIKTIENSDILKSISKIKYKELIIASLISLSFITNKDILFYYFIGIFLFLILKSLDHIFSLKDIKSGFIGFLYLEILDASFSFDGVIGAFALSNNIFIIMLGLGIGAFFVRSLTIYFVQKKTLQKFLYLEHGAHYAIGVLAILMLMKIFYHINETFIGTVGLAIVALAFYQSVKKNKE